ncbi:MAG: HU family DNA-binding protein [Bacteroidales bacterium]
MADMHYIIVKRSITIKGVKEDRFMPSLLNHGMLKTKNVAQKIAKQSTISVAEAENFLGALADIIIDELEAGWDVKIDGLGTFSPAIMARAVKDIKDCNADTIKRKYIKFEPSTELKAEFKNATFRKADIDVQHV